MPAFYVKDTKSEIAELATFQNNPTLKEIETTTKKTIWASKEENRLECFVVPTSSPPLSLKHCCSRHQIYDPKHETKKKDPYGEFEKKERTDGYEGIVDGGSRESQEARDVGRGEEEKERALLCSVFKKQRRKEDRGVW